VTGRGEGQKMSFTPCAPDHILGAMILLAPPYTSQDKAPTHQLLRGITDPLQRSASASCEQDAKEKPPRCAVDTQVPSAAARSWR